ncbi:hypothetical protein ABZW32_39360 [Streptomyces sp. NPDC004667]|uniref:hypothetical protein n=1 Tax=Streptomyces sp. NPDC004667 TaxID=3154285 RepID=UPI0033BD47E5
MNERFWIDAPETERRRQVLDVLYAEIGIIERGKNAAIAGEIAKSGASCRMVRFLR